MMSSIGSVCAHEQNIYSIHLHNLNLAMQHHVLYKVCKHNVYTRIAVSANCQTIIYYINT